MAFFENIIDQESLKCEFRRLALLHHPDHDGDAASFRELWTEYQRLLQTLPEKVEQEEESDAIPEMREEETSEKQEPGRFHCPYQPAGAGGANPHVLRLARPIFTHEELCKIARSLFQWGKAKGDLTAFYRKLCRLLDPGQSLPYRDYFLDRKGAGKVLKLLREMGFRRIFEQELWRLAKEAEKNLTA